jgi:hypothetical protein
VVALRRGVADRHRDQPDRPGRAGQPHHGAGGRRQRDRHGGRHLPEVVPFWILSFTGLALSTLTVSLAATWADAAGLGGAARTALIEMANVAAWGTLWVAQFVILDRYLFHTKATTRSRTVAASLTDEAAR